MFAENIRQHTMTKITRQQQPAYCPACRQRTCFERAGVQHWPPDIAAAAGLPATMPLWTCSNCHTTLSEPDLMF
jgi:ribosomal protein L37AE/L43A